MTCFAGLVVGCIQTYWRRWCRELLLWHNLSTHPSLLFPAAVHFQAVNLTVRCPAAAPPDYLSPVKNQGDCSSCVAYAVVASVEAAVAKVTRTKNIFSEYDLFNCTR
jgi:hypothetical protein